MNTSELLDLAKQRHQVSDYGLAKLLQVGPSTVGNYRQGRSHPDDRIATRLAELAELDPGQVVAWLQVERAKDDETRNLWRGIAARLARSTPAALCLAVMISAAPDTRANSFHANISNSPADNMSGQSVYYVKLRRAWRRLAAMLARLAGAPVRVPCPPALA